MVQSEECQEDVELEEGKMSEEKQHRELFFTNLLSTLEGFKPDGSRLPFAVGGAVSCGDGAAVLECMSVAGAGVLHLLLSTQDAMKLRLVCEQPHPAEQGEATLGNITSVCRVAYASQVWFHDGYTFMSSTVKGVAVEALKRMGLDKLEMQLEVQLHKVLLHEPSGISELFHHKANEIGVFANMVIQLPSEGGFEGGALVVSQGKECTTFDFSKGSSNRYFYTAFFADCKYKLENVTRGAQLCLVCNLVRKLSISKSHSLPLEVSNLPVRMRKLMGMASMSARLEAALTPWIEAIHGDSVNGVFPRKLAIPLRHKYTEQELSFHNLKGHDRILAKIMKQIQDSNQKNLLDVFLCMLTRHERGYGGGSNMVEVITTEIYIAERKWVGLDDQIVNFDVVVDVDSEVVVNDTIDELFDVDGEPDMIKSTQDSDGEDEFVDHFYHRAVMIVWQKKHAVAEALDAGIGEALKVVEWKQKNEGASVSDMLGEILIHARRTPFWYQNSSGTYKLLKLCLMEGTLEDVLCVLSLPIKVASRYRRQSMEETETFELIGIPDINFAELIAQFVQKHGWRNYKAIILKGSDKKQARRDQVKNYVHLATILEGFGCLDAAIKVAKLIHAFVVSTMPEKPEFTWKQASAKLSEHPIVEAFLRGPEESFRYSGGFSNGLSAMNFARTYFNGFFGEERVLSNGYSARAVPGGSVFQSFCDIKKTRETFDNALAQWMKLADERSSILLQLKKFNICRECGTMNENGDPKKCLDSMGHHPGKTRKITERVVNVISSAGVEEFAAVS